MARIHYVKTYLRQEEQKKEWMEQVKEIEKEKGKTGEKLKILVRDRSKWKKWIKER